MLIGLEGKPRSGKSHDLVRVHVLENLRSGRRVYARLNGLDHAAIADYLGADVSYVTRLLVDMSESEVAAWCTCETHDDGSMSFPYFDRDSVVIVDECHDYWPLARQEMPPHMVAFFAKHGHWGLDLVLATQDFKEVHRSVVRRMDKKNVYTKLDALGADNSYTVRYFTSPQVGRFEQVGVDKLSYDPKIWALYAGIQPGVAGNAPYKPGTRTLWVSARKPAAAVFLALVVGIYFIADFFLSPAEIVPVASPPPETVQSGPMKGLVVVDKPPSPVSVPPPVQSSAAGASASPVTAVAAAVRKEPDYPPGISYIVDLLEDARPRYAGSIGRYHLVEFRTDGGWEVVERLTTLQLSALGWSVTPTAYGMRADYEDQTVIFTPWPLEDRRLQQSTLTGEALRAMPLITGPAAQSAPLVAPSEDAPAQSGTAMRYGQMASYGGIGVTP